MQRPGQGASDDKAEADGGQRRQHQAEEERMAHLPDIAVHLVQG